MRYYLVDNGSLRAASVLNLRRVAGELSRHTGIPVTPASLLHSSRVPVDELGGEPAINLERRLKLDHAAGERDFRIIPFFFGPTAAITDYLPGRIAFLRGMLGDFSVEVCPFLYPAGPRPPADLVGILRERVEAAMAETGWHRPYVAMVDHGSPQPGVAAVRNELSCELAGALGSRIGALMPCSMERREAPEYAFNEPLLARLLADRRWRGRKVIVSMLFLSPGRHAGPDGDIASICAAAQAADPALRTHMTDLVGTHPDIIGILAARMRLGWTPILTDSAALIKCQPMPPTARPPCKWP